MEDGLHKGLALYRNGTISFTQLNRNWISSTSWFQRHKDWRLLYLWDKNLSNPDSHKPEIRDYKAEWVPAFNPT
uniref:Uncharacterized protein n=3 Tax=Meloidogyne TaxID=189290 RepID=A0A6V7WCB8_MELEN|nr:unnamed protein product [Meloidogyne enterolobii]CAD2164523.1 unnamed protein product [Meloidogyne enterolobii]CAD2184642.1 unnamed protein product [Meloidogyne enterolobii]